MTMPEGSTETEVDFYGSQSRPIHVISTNAKPGKAIAAEFGQWNTVVVANVQGPLSVTPGAQRLINRSLRRHRTHIIVSATVAGQPVTDGVIIGSPGQIASGMPAIPGQLGGFLPIGISVRWEVQQELWVCFPQTNTDSVFVTTCDEQYASDPDSARKESRD